ncbi:hypothetical protein SSX86_016288 [Deinandra increscens subsp. villosa]|uniref:DUF4216 domain-containing protein n=1 Tax=Deinandra increscens subsp. villosa TaxID=3103831 RepID=A0AAP0GX10_9ASTR
MYLEGVQTKFNRPGRNADDGIPKRQLAVFSSPCRPMSKKIYNSFDRQSWKTFEWFVLNNCDEVKEYIDKFKFEFPAKKALANCILSPCSYTACIVNGVRFLVHSRDIQRTTQNSGVVSLDEDKYTYYGQLEDIIELKYLSGYSVVLFRCKWFDTANSRSFKKNHGTYIDISREAYADQPYILATQAKQVFYLQDPSRANGNWRVVEYVHHQNIWDHPSISVADEIDVVHDTQSSSYNLVAQSIDGVHNTEPCNLFIDLGPLPMRSSEGGTSSSTVVCLSDEDEDEDE